MEFMTQDMSQTKLFSKKNKMGNQIPTGCNKIFSLFLYVLFLFGFTKENFSNMFPKI